MLSKADSLSAPQAGTEKFIRNFEDAIVRVVGQFFFSPLLTHADVAADPCLLPCTVRDSALREKDPILGIVNLPLKKLFAEASEVTRMFSLEEGQGFGRVNISLLFRPLKVDLPPVRPCSVCALLSLGLALIARLFRSQNMLGWETGTVEVTAPCVIELDPAHTDLIDDFKKLTLSTSDSTEHLTKKEASITGNRIEWDVGRIRLRECNRRGFDGKRQLTTLRHQRTCQPSTRASSRSSRSRRWAALTLASLVPRPRRSPSSGYRSSSTTRSALFAFPSSSPRTLSSCGRTSVLHLLAPSCPAPIELQLTLALLISQYINEFTAKTHEYEIVRPAIALTPSTQQADAAPPFFLFRLAGSRPSTSPPCRPDDRAHADQV